MAAQGLVATTTPPQPGPSTTRGAGLYPCHMAELRVVCVRGQVPVLVAPVPERAVLPLPFVTSLAVREWCVVTAPDELGIAGHTFHIVGWSSSSTPGLVLEHDCQPCAHTCGPA